MSLDEKKKINKAMKADLQARKFVLNERLNRCKDTDQALEILREINLIDHRLECLGNRILINSKLAAKNKEKVSNRWNVAAKEKTFTITRR